MFKVRKRTSCLNRTKDFSCPLCEMKFYEEKTLSRHHLLKHTENRTKDFPCDMCNKALYEMSKLKLHIKKVHSENKLSCNVCGKLFKTSDNLKIHKKTHDTCFEVGNIFTFFPSHIIILNF